MNTNLATKRLTNRIVEVLANKRDFRWWFDKRQYGDDIQWDDVGTLLRETHGLFAEHQAGHLFFVEKVVDP